VRGYAGAEEPDARALEGLLMASVQALRQHPRDDKLLRAVERTYAPGAYPGGRGRGAGAAVQHLSRHLSQAVGRIVAWLWDHEVYGSAPEQR
jgi:hypothetical protein